MNNNIILGAGPAGLATGYRLTKEKENFIIIEKEKEVGGLSKSFKFKGCIFDIGPHLFKTRNKEITALWDIMSSKKYAKNDYPAGMLYNKRVYKNMNEMVHSLPINKLFLAGVSTLLSRVKLGRIKNGADWIKKTRGKKIYSQFYKLREEKFWGVPIDKIEYDWYEKRFGNPKISSMLRSLKRRLIGKIQKKEFEPSINDTTYHPLHGAGSMYNSLYKEIKKDKKNKILLNNIPIKLNHNGKRITSLLVKNLKDGKEKEYPINEIISTIPIMEAIRMLNPLPPKEILNLCDKLKYRDIVLVNFVAKLKKKMKHSFLNVYSNDVKMFRLTNFANLSERMGGKDGSIPLCIEYNCFEGDKFWNMKDEEILEFAKKELEKIKLSSREELKDGFVIRYPKAYPIHSVGFRKIVNQLINYLKQFENFQTIGRNGQFTYNQMRHSVESGLRAGEKSMGLIKSSDVLRTTDEGKDVLG